MNLNTINIGGRLTRDPELRTTTTGKSVVEFTLANNHAYKAPNGERIEEATFIDVTFFNKTADVIAKHFSKGKPICVIGRLRQERWTDKETGKERSKLSVRGEKFEFVGGKDDQ
jgi:single-strand DNA-binding protein